MILEPGWQAPQYLWNTKKYPSVPNLISTLNETGTQLILWEHPILDLAAPLTALLRKSGCIAGHEPAPRSTNNAFTDLTLPKCQNLWKQFQLANVIKQGAKGFKLDEDDVDMNIGFVDDTVFPSGMTGAFFHNIQGYILQRIFHEMYESIGQRTWLQSRGNFAGGQAYPTNSYSDGYTYSTYVRGVVNSGFSGLIWAPELRQATCDADFARRSQLMFMSPQAQYNAWNSPEPKARPWECTGSGLNSSTWTSFKKHYDLRKGLATYLYSAFEAQGRTGLPLARALVMDSPEDSHTWSVDDQFLIGASLMFAPAGMDKPKSTSVVRSVYFPPTATSWHPWFANATKYTPGRVTSVPSPILDAPLFVKGGSVVPFQRPGSEEHVLELVVFAPATCTDGIAWSSVYDDDGETTRYKTQGEHWRGRAGYACNATHHALHFEVVHATFATQWSAVRWRLHHHHGGALGTEELPPMPIGPAAAVHVVRRWE